MPDGWRPGAGDGGRHWCSRSPTAGRAWQLDPDGGRCAGTRATATIVLGYADALAMALGELDPADALAAGRVRVRGELAALVAGQEVLAAAAARSADARRADRPDRPGRSDAGPGRPGAEPDVARSRFSAAARPPASAAATAARSPSSPAPRPAWAPSSAATWPGPARSSSAWPATRSASTRWPPSCATHSPALAHDHLRRGRHRGAARHPRRRWRRRTGPSTCSSTTRRRTPACAWSTSTRRTSATPST